MSDWVVTNPLGHAGEVVVVLLALGLLAVFISIPALLSALTCGYAISVGPPRK